MNPNLGRVSSAKSERRVLFSYNENEKFRWQRLCIVFLVRILYMSKESHAMQGHVVVNEYIFFVFTSNCKKLAQEMIEGNISERKRTTPICSPILFQNLNSRSCETKFYAYYYFQIHEKQDLR